MLAHLVNLFELIKKHFANTEEATSERLLEVFMDYTMELNLELYPAQEEGILELFDDNNVILNTPTGSGKSLVAMALHFKSLAQGRKSVYTSPIKALVNEKFLDLCSRFGADQVGLMTGDATVNRKAPILCCTAEILANIALHEGEKAEVHDIIIDEFHYYSDRDRGGAWQTPLLTLSQSRFLLMSATMGNVEFFVNALTSLTGVTTSLVQSFDRPVPLEFSYEEIPMEQVVENLVEDNKAPVYIVHFTQMEAAQNAQNFTSINVCTKEEKKQIAELLKEVRFTSPYGKDIKKYLRHGIGIHHAGLLPKYRILVERMAQKGLLKLICGTDTLGVGVNVPIRTVLLTRLCKYDGQKTGILTVRDFHQICGRAGRKGFDDKGWVISMAPDHVIENLKMERKAADNPKKKKKFVKKQPPQKGYVPWDKKTFERLIQATPEPLTSRFQMTHGTLLNVLSRPGDGCAVLRKLIRDCHETDASKRALRRRAWQLFRSLLDRGIIEWVKPEENQGAHVRVNMDLQEDFSLNQILALYMIDTLPVLDKESPTYVLDLITLAESILEDPIHVLRKQLDKVKDRKMAEWKAEGMEYDQRMEELEKLEYPKPNREFIYETFNQFAKTHPWVGEENIRPKSVAREMVESFLSFDDYIRSYSLQRVEGVLLRYVTEVYKVMTQTIPDEFNTPEVREAILFLELMIRQTDSSLLDEWEKMRDPQAFAKKKEIETDTKENSEANAQADENYLDPIRNRKAFEVVLRNQVFSIVRLLAMDHLDEAGQRLAEFANQENVEWPSPRLEDTLASYFEEYDQIRLDADARNPKWIQINDESQNTWKVRQTLLDPEDHADWALSFEIDIPTSKKESRPVMRLVEFLHS
jgi:superfamily II RNA helicase